MKRFKKTAAQGEMFFTRLDPREARDYLERSTRTRGFLRPTTVKGRHVHVIGHSETGHHHVMDAERTELKALPDSLTKLLIVKPGPEVPLEHLRPTDTHEPIAFAPGTYLVTTMREFNPMEQRSQAVYD